MTLSQAPKTVLQVIPSLQTGGAEKTAVDIAAKLVETGWRSIVASQGGRLVDQLVEGGSEHVHLPLDTKNPIQMLINAVRLVRIIRSQGVDLVHARSRGPAWSALWAARWCDIKFVTTYHGAYSQKNRLKAWYNSVMARADRVIANSAWTADLIKARRPAATERIRIIHRGTDFSDFDPKTIDPARTARMADLWGIADHDRREKDIVLLMGRLSPIKGQKTVIDAAGDVLKRHPNTLFVLAGDDRDRAEYVTELRQLIAASNLSTKVLLPGHCDDPAAAMAIADIVLSASTRPEAFGRTIVEAEALNKPVIVTDIGATAETVLGRHEVGPDDYSGWKILPGDPSDLARALDEALSMTKAQREIVGKRGRGHVLPRFSLEQMCEKTINTYRELLY